MMDPEQTWPTPNPGYLTYYPHEPPAPGRVIPPPSVLEPPNHAGNTGPIPLSTPVFGVSGGGDDPSGRRLSHAPLQPNLCIRVSSVPPSPQTTTASGSFPPPLLPRPPPATAELQPKPVLPPFAHPFYPSHREPGTGYPDSYPPPSHHLHHPTPIPAAGQAYTPILSSYSPMESSPALSGHRPSLHHYNSSPRMSSMGTSIDRGYGSFSASSSTHPLPPPSPHSSYSSGLFTSAPFQPGIGPPSYPPPQRQWIHRHSSAPRISLDTSMDGGYSSTDGSYSTSPTTQRMAPVSPFHTHHNYPPASSSSSSYPSVQPSMADLPASIKKEPDDLSVKKEEPEASGSGGPGGDGKARLVKGKRRVSGTRGSAGSWSGEDMPVPGSEDDDQPWGMPREVYQALTPKDKKQIRNKVGARRFRARKKDYLAALESSVQIKEEELSVLRQKVQSQREEIHGYRLRLGLPPLTPSPPLVTQSDAFGLGLGLSQMGDDELKPDPGPLGAGG